MKFAVALLLGALLALPLSATSPVDQLDAVALELEAIVGELELSQAQTAELRSHLVSLQALSEEHQTALKNQADQLAEYQRTVSSLEEHDRVSTALTGWLIPLTGVAVAVAVLEAFLLVLR